MECDSLDITTAFLNADLDETIYMKPPPGYEQYLPEGKKLYCLLLKAIYSLKQGSRQWYLKLSEVIIRKMSLPWSAIECPWSYSLQPVELCLLCPTKQGSLYKSYGLAPQALH